MKKIEFVRWGGLSAVQHKEFYKLNTFHSPPLKRGIYVFHPEWIEPFLVSWKWWKGEERINIKQRRFFLFFSLQDMVIIV